MKKVFALLVFWIASLGCILAFAALVPMPIDNTQIVNIGSDVLKQSGSSAAAGWLAEYWVYIALIASEALAFIPTKFSGLAHAVLQIGQSLFGKK